MTEITLHPLQQEAVDLCCNMDNRLCCVTGAAGTGKTTILKQAFAALEAHGYKCALVAPTGKAAKRIYELTGIQAYTIHRFLEYTHPGDPDPKTGQPIGVSMPRRTRQNPVEFDVVFADEYAMVPDELHRNLVDALPRGGVIRCFGDDNQLGPIEEDKSKQGLPSPFKKMLDDDKLGSVRLDHVYRQGEDSGILYNCQLILKGRMPTRNDQFSLAFTDLAVMAVKDYILAQRDVGNDFSLIDNQLIVPQNKSGVGTTKLNTLLQQAFHSYSDEHMMLDRKPWALGEGDEKGGKIRVFLGDKVIITSNLYELGVFNGETGTVIELEHETGEVTIDFGDREQTIPPVLMVQNRYGGTSTIDPRKDIDLAYAITTHKSQGSEYKRGIYVLNKSNSYMISRRNLYTAVSRFKEHLHLITDQRGLALALQKRD